MKHQENTAKKMSSEPEAPSSTPQPQTVRVTNKLGTFEYDRNLSIHFPVGVVGFPDIHEFGISNLSENFGEFKLLQCLDDTQLSFIVLPLEAAKAPIDAEDLIEASKSLGIPMQDLALLFIITIRSMGPDHGHVISMNHRAPVMVDTNRRIARQYVFSNNKYPVQHVIS